MDATTSRQVCEIIAGLLFADGELHPDEAKFFGRLLTRFGMAEDTRVTPVDDAAAAVARLRQLSPEIRTETLGLLIAAAGSDGVLHPAERILIGAVAEELGVGEEELEQRLQNSLTG